MTHRKSFMLLAIALVLLAGIIAWDWNYTGSHKDNDILEFLQSHYYPPVGIPELAAMASDAYIDEVKPINHNEILRKWHRIEEMRTDAVSGLAYTIYTHYVDELEHWLVVFAFRGTEFNDIRDWRSNFRALRIKSNLGEEDQYIAGALRILREIDWAYDEFGPQSTYYAVGHSLGGGLAQLAGHIHPWINNVFIFNSSPVTGWDIALEETEASLDWQPFNIVSIFEQGEVLEYARNIYSLANDLPDEINYTEFAFNYTTGNLIYQHNMKSLASGILSDSIRFGLHSIDNRRLEDN